MPKGHANGFHPDWQYRGGSVNGHAPTSDGSQLPKQTDGELVRAHRFGQPGGNDPRGNPGRPATAKQRFCMEAIERGESFEKLTKRNRFPGGMVRRLMALHAASLDPENRFFLQAQQLIRTILIAPARKEDSDAEREARREPDSITVTVGRLNVPLPGADPDDPAPPEGGSGSAGAEGAVNAPLSTEKPAG